jgi:RNA exonuclease 4
VQVLGLNHPATAIRDTVLFFTLQGQSKSLKHLAERLLGQNIQTGRHSSVEDARAPVLLYRKFW